MSERAPITVKHKSVSIEKLLVGIFENIFEISKDFPVLSGKYIRNCYVEHFSAPVHTVAGTHQNTPSLGPTKTHAQ
jgi:hypothetical protein